MHWCIWSRWDPLEYGSIQLKMLRSTEKKHVKIFAQSLNAQGSRVADPNSAGSGFRNDRIRISEG